LKKKIPLVEKKHKVEEEISFSNKIEEVIDINSTQTNLLSEEIKI